MIRRKKVHVDLGEKGGFTINHPGVVRRAAARKGETTHEWAEEHEGESGVEGRRARSALGLMAMGKKKRRS